MLPISDIIIRSICGYVFMIPVLLLYYRSLSKAGRRQQPLHIVTMFVFCYYLFGVLTVTGIGYTRLRHFEPNFALIPFIDMIRGPIDTALNVILFMPLGLFLPLLYKKYRSMKAVACMGLLFSLSIELVQMFGWGTTDINDLITNTLGACLGFILYARLARNARRKFAMQLQSDTANGTAALLLLMLYSFAVMVAIQPWVIHDLLNIL